MLFVSLIYARELLVVGNRAHLVATEGFTMKSSRAPPVRQVVAVGGVGRRIYGGHRGPGLPTEHEW